MSVGLLITRDVVLGPVGAGGRCRAECMVQQDARLSQVNSPISDIKDMQHQPGNTLTTMQCKLKALRVRNEDLEGWYQSYPGHTRIGKGWQYGALC
ncbi:hypothetical protein NDU88_005795 [Pleurodeles waltl]|uniref:Uncharacterized protein n=1 Tax=Pleurodeles waltl TaxID=8319 RepID=A0AAV7RQ15_PLEWA|nr:hypothetical protein NDU88_005795 [Pleurodeles waltl]